MKEKKLDYRSKAGFAFRHFLTSVNEMNVEKHNVSHSHPAYEIYYLISGEVKYIISGKPYNVKPGDVICIHPFENHIIEANPEIDYERCVIEFEMGSIPKINGTTPLFDYIKGNFPAIHIPADVVKTSNIPNIFESIQKTCQNPNEFTNHLLLGDIIKMVAELRIVYEKISGMDAIENDSETLLYNDWLNRVVTYIKANITKKITIDDLANYTFLSRSYLQHLFKESVGVSISEYIFRQKMHLAQYMLKNGTSLNDVSDLLGYKYYSTFCMHYKKMFGTSPKNHYGKP